MPKKTLPKVNTDSSTSSPTEPSTTTSTDYGGVYTPSTTSPSSTPYTPYVPVQPTPVPIPSPKKEPKINQRFIYTLKFRAGRLGSQKETVALTADGHIDYAHKVGLKEVHSELITRERQEDPSGNITWWATVKVIITLENGIIASGISCCSSREVSKPGFEVSVAETRALKRAIAVACNITEELISPSAKEPTRETVDIPLDEDTMEDNAFSHVEVPKEIVKPHSEVLGDDFGI